MGLGEWLGVAGFGIAAISLGVGIATWRNKAMTDMVNFLTMKMHSLERDKLSSDARITDLEAECGRLRAEVLKLMTKLLLEKP